MKMAFTIGTKEKIDVVIERNWSTGRFMCIANGQVHTIKNLLNPGAHFSTKLKKVYTIEVSTTSRHLITIEHNRPLLFSGFRPHEYKVKVDGKVVSQYRGY